MREIIWCDDFNYSGFPNSNRWTFEIQELGWVNEEKQHYVKELANCRVENGKLIIEAHYNPESEKKYTSSRLKTQFKGDWLYGRIEVKAKLPRGQGTWPAIWLMPTHSKYGKWPNSGEIDIMEHVGFDPGWIHASIHCKEYNWKVRTQKTAKVYDPSVQDEFHLYFLNWDENGIEVGMDDEIYFRYSKPDNYSPHNWPFNQDFYLILNIAIGGVWGGVKGIDDSIFPQRMVVEYVKVYQ